MVSREELAKIARLAKLSLDETQLDAARRDMAQIVAFADTVNALATEEDASFDRTPTEDLREDAVVPSRPRADILMNVDGGKDGCFPVRERSEVQHG